MPKKRTYNFKQLQGASSSAANGRPGSSKNGSIVNKESTSVNEQLGELRKIEGSEAAQVKRDLAEAVNLRSVPPQLRGILGVPESAPPKPKYGSRQQRVGSRIAGPAPPRSWLRPGSTGLSSLALRSRGRKFGRSASQTADRKRAPQAWRFARVTDFAPNTDSDNGPRSLLHLCLKTAAQEWESFDEVDYPELINLDLRLRTRLLSYIGYYGPSIGVKGFEALVQGYDPIQLLDLAGLVGHGTLTSGRLAKTFKASSLQASKQSQVVESWEEADSLEMALTTGISMPRFSHLTHLCLSHPASNVSWKDLLSLSKQVPKVTHLSLAYWPRPTLTPNLSMTTVSSGRSPEVIAGGSHYYSALDGDFSEPASLLRQLSSNLLCLQWLDLEGCADWMGALSMFSPVQRQERRSENSINFWNQITSYENVFLDHWKNVTYLNCFQGWLPSKAGMGALPRQLMSSLNRSVVDDFLKNGKDDIQPGEDQADQSYDVAKRKAEIWLQSEASALHHGSRINVMRRENGLKPILIDHGWRERYI